MCINYDSLGRDDKRAELNCLVNHHNPHIILGQETRLGPDIPLCEGFPKGFKSFCRDRVMGGGASSSWSEMTLTMLRMSFQLTIKTVRASGSNLDTAMQNY